MTMPYGARDLKLTPFAAAEALAVASVDLPRYRTLSFADTEEFTDLRGDDKVVATVGSGSSVEWSLENGGIDLPSYKAIAGGTVITSGVTPNTKTTYTKKVTDRRPYFRAEGQSVTDEGGDVHAILPKCKAKGNIEGEFADQEFFVTSCSGVAYPLVVAQGTIDIDTVYQFIENETAAAIT